MAAFIKAVSGSQTATNTNTLAVTVTAGTAAGNQLVCAICTPGARLVSSVTDSAGNAWHKVNSVLNTADIELWKTDAVNTLAIAPTTGTFTVTCNGNGRFVCILGEFSGVAFTGTEQSTTNTGTSASATITQAIDDANDYLITVVGSIGNAFTQSSGTVPTNGTAATTGCSIAFIYQTNASAGASLTNTASLTSAVWGAVATDLRLLTASTPDAMSFSDGLTRVPGVSRVLTDTESANWADTLASTKANILSKDLVDAGSVFQDDFATNLAELLSIEDAITTSLDEFAYTLGGGTTPITEILTDTTSANWLDVVSESFGSLLVITDSATSNWADVLLPDAGGISYIAGSAGSNKSIITTATSLVVTLGTSVGAGNTLVVVCAFGSSTSYVNSVTDDAGNTYICRGRSGNSNGIEIWTTEPGESVGTATTVTANYAAGSKASVIAAGYKNVANIGKTLRNLAATANPTGSITTQDTNNFVLGGFAGAGNNSITSNAGGTLRLSDITDVSGTGNVANCLVDSTNASAAATSVTVTLAAESWAGLLLELRTGEAESTKITHDVLEGAGSNSSATSYTTGTVTPVANALILLTVRSGVAASGPPNTPTVSGCSLNWVSVQSNAFNIAATPLSRHTVFRAMGAAPTSGALTIDFAGQTQNGVSWSIEKFNSVDTSGADGSGAIVQSNSTNTDSASFLTQTLSALADPDNLAFGSIGVASTADAAVANAGFEIGSGWGRVPHLTQYGVNQTVVRFNQPTAASALVILEIAKLTANNNFTESLTDNNTNWSDAVQKLLSLGLTVTDSETGNWIDVLNIGYGNGLTDQLLATDSFAVNTSYEVSFIDSETANWTDLLTQVFSFAETVTDNLNSWADAVGVGYGDGLADTLSLLDALTFVEAEIVALSDALTITDGLARGYGSLLTDSLNLTDVLVLSQASSITKIISDQLQFVDLLASLFGYGNGLADTMLQSDALTFSEAELLAFADSLSVTDALGVGYADVIADTLTASDSLVVNFGMVRTAADQMTVADSLVSGYGLLISDSDNTWLDALQMGYAVGLLDTLLLSDVTALVFSYGETFTDSLVLTDLLKSVFSYNESLSDPLQLSDSLANLFGYGTGLTDALSQSDAMTLTEGELLALVDTGSIADALRVGYGDVIADALTVSDTLAASFGMNEIAADQMTATDRLASGYGLLIADSDTTWLDSFSYNAGQPLLQQAVADALSFNNNLALGYGVLLSDALTLSDRSTVAFVLSASIADSLTDWLDDLIYSGISTPLTMDATDSLDNWDDFVPSFTQEMAIDIGIDQLLFTDVLSKSLSGGSQIVATDSLTIADSLRTGYGDILSDNLSLSDALAEVFGMQEVLVSSLSLSDGLSSGYAYLELLSDALSLSELLSIGYGVSSSDALSITEAVTSGYGLLVSDSDTGNWTEAVAQVLSTGQALADQITLSDLLLAGYGNALSNQLTISDSLLTGYADLITDSLLFDDALQTGYSLAIIDTDTLSDNFRIGFGYGLLFADSEAGNWNSLVNILINQPLIQRNFSDSLLVADDVDLGYGFGFSDALFLIEDVDLGRSLLLIDSETANWSDVLLKQVGRAIVIADGTETANWQDALRSGYGFGISDALIQTEDVDLGYGGFFADALQLTEDFDLGYGLVLSDSERANWFDALTMTSDQYREFTDSNSANWADRIVAGYGDILADQLSFVDVLAVGSSAGFSALLTDSLQLAESINTGYGSLLSDTEALNWFDALAAGVGIPKLFSDQMTATDLLNNAVGASILFSDSLLLTDLLKTGYGFSIFDAEGANWADSLPFGSLITEVLFDAESANWADTVGTGYGNFLQDSGESDWQDSVLALAGNETLLFDSLLITDTTSRAMDHLLGVSDALLPVDEYTAVGDLLLSVSDFDSSNWGDFAFATSVIPLAEGLADDIAALWQDNIANLFVGAVGSARLLRITTQPRMQVHVVRVQPSMLIHKLAINAGLSHNFVVPLTIVLSDKTDDNWNDSTASGNQVPMMLNLGDSSNNWRG